LFVLLASQGFLAQTVPNAFLPSLIGKMDYGHAQGPWHTAYIGFGWKENKYGIIYKDGSASAKVKEYDPGITYLSEEYMRVLRSEYFKLLKEDPAFFIGSYLNKFVKITKMCFGYFKKRGGVILAGVLLCIFMVAYMLTPGSQGCKLSRKLPRTLRSTALLMLPCGLFCVFAGMIPAMIAVPRTSYLTGPYAACGLLKFTLAVITALFVVRIFAAVTGHGKSESLH
jgi:hypothetical protein